MVSWVRYEFTRLEIRTACRPPSPQGSLIRSHQLWERLNHPTELTDMQLAPFPWQHWHVKFPAGFRFDRMLRSHWALPEPQLH